MTAASAAGTFGALGAAVCFGAAAVLQAVGARGAAAGRGVDARLLWRLARSLPYLAGLGLDLLGFGLALVAMRTMPLFAVEAMFASYVGVAAALATWWLGARLRPAEWAVLGLLVAGLVLLASSVAAPATPTVTTTVRWLLVASVVALAAAAAGAARRRGRAGAALLAVLAGLLWGLVAISVRVLRAPGSLPGLLADPATYSLLAAGGFGLLAYTVALARASVTVATALAIVGEVLVPAAVGLLWLGDRPRPGGMVWALAGFGLTVGAALALARHAELEPGPAGSPARGSGAGGQRGKAPTGQR